MNEEQIITEQPIPHTKYALLTPESYTALNDLIGQALGFPEGGTMRYAETDPALDVNGNCVMPITVEVQGLNIELPELFDTYEQPATSENDTY